MNNTGPIVSLLLTTAALAGCGEEPCHPEIKGSADAYEFGELSTDSVSVSDPVRVEWEYDCYTVYIEARGDTEDPEALRDLVLETSRAKGFYSRLHVTSCGLDIDPGVVAYDWQNAFAVVRALTGPLKAANLQGTTAIVVEPHPAMCLVAEGN